MPRQLNVFVNTLLLFLASAILSWGHAGPQKSVTPQTSASKPTPPLAPNKATQSPIPPMPQSDQMTNVPYFTVRDGMDSILTLQNLAPTPIPVTVTIFNLEGRAKVLEPITIDPHSFKDIDLAAVVKDDFDSGNIEVAYHGKSMDITCQVGVSNLAKRVSFESREQDMMDFESPNLNGIVSLPQKDAKGFLAVTNASKNQVTVHVSVGSRTKDLVLYSRETHVLKLDDEFGLHAPAAALVKLTQNGLPGDIITTGFVMDLENGYSSAFTMTDPKIMRSSHLAGAHFYFGRPDPSEGFPAGTTFTSPLRLANVNDKPVTAHISVDYSVQEESDAPTVAKPSTSARNVPPISPQPKFKTTVVPVGDVQIGPGEVQQVELSDALAGVVSPINDTGVDVDYDGTPGSLIGQLVSVDQSGDYSFEVPVKDPSAMNALTEGMYPWTIENGTKSVIHLKNTTNAAVRAHAMVNFAGGTYTLGEIPLQPYETISIDLQQLKNSKKPDTRGQIFPAKITEGQFVWSQMPTYSMIGRLEETNTSQGIARSFSCGPDCCGYWETPFASNDVSGPAGGSDSYYIYVNDADCDSNTDSWTYGAADSDYVDDSTIVASIAGANSYPYDTVSFGESTGQTTIHNEEVDLGYMAYNGSLSCQWFSQAEYAQNTATVSEPTCSMNLNFTNNKTPGDNLMFTSDFRECTEGLGPTECDGVQWWHLNMEGSVTTSNDASRWTISQQIVSSRQHGHAIDSNGDHVAFDQPVLPNGPDGPSPDFTQNPAGQNQLFWIDGPGHFFQNGVGPISDMIFIMNFTDTVQSLDYPDVTCTANWFARLEVDFGPELNTVSSYGGDGWLSLD